MLCDMLRSGFKVSQPIKTYLNGMFNLQINVTIYFQLRIYVLTSIWQEHYITVDKYY